MSKPNYVRHEVVLTTVERDPLGRPYKDEYVVLRTRFAWRARRKARAIRRHGWGRQRWSVSVRPTPREVEG